jgi:tetratricopeptide (TPR) repeat protein
MKHLLLTLLIIGVSAYTTYYLWQRGQQIKLLPALTQSSSQTIVPSTSDSPRPSLAPIPTRKVLSGGTHMFQTFNNCGPASLSMALSYYDIQVTQQLLGQELRPYQQAQGDNDDKSVTLYELAEKAAEYNLTAYNRPAGDIELLQQFIAHDIPVITRTWLKPGEDIGHFRVVKGYDQATGQLIQDDSLQGKDLSYDNEEFLELWEAFNYEFLVLVPSEKKIVAETILGERLDPQSAWQQALEFSESKLQQQPENIYAQFNQSVALYYLGRYADSIAAYEQVATQLPSRMLWYQLEPILAYYKSEDFDSVLELSDQILNNQNRAYSELHYLKGLVFEKQGVEDRAAQSFADAKRYNSQNYWQANLESVLP